MKTYYKITLTLLSILAFINLPAQNNFFVDKAESSFITLEQKRVIIPNKYRTIGLDMIAMKIFLLTLPNEFAVANKNTTPIIDLPMPNGAIAQFHIWETKVMEQGLADMVPNIKTYTGQGITDKTATLSLSMTEFGLNAMILSNITGSIFIDQYDQQTTTNYISYYKKDFTKKDVYTEMPPIKLNRSGGGVKNLFAAGQCIGTQRRNYRVAVACTHQYAMAATGLANPTKAQALAKIVTSINRVNQVYELEVGIHLNLVANNLNIVYAIAATDTALGQFNTGVPDQLLFKTQAHITLIIGSANFDIGHTFSTGAGGMAFVGGVCQNDLKAGGVTGTLNPVGDPFDIDYVSHEMGHQFGGNHTFNATTGDCFDNANDLTHGATLATATNCEPGSGSTIMAYAGICGVTNDLQPHSDAQFHAASLAEILDYTILDVGNNCPTITATNNHTPTASAGADYTIPVATPFFLKGNGTDVDNDALTYSWEEIDVAGNIGDWNAAQTVNIPLFRSFTPDTAAIRYFPKLNDVVNNITTIGERLPTITRTLKFRLTVRDNKAGGGGSCFDDATISVNATGGAFIVNYPSNSGITWLNGESKTITWNNGSTTAAPFNVANVAIELSVDGGFTYPITLVANTPNDGTENIIVPKNFTTTARVRVRALGNIFYDISNNNFTIALNPLPVNWLNITAQKQLKNTVQIDWNVNEIDNHLYEVERSIEGEKFEKIGIVNASKENGANHNYLFIDKKPFAAKNYYRIKQIDKDGHFSYSKIVFVILNETNSNWILYPNPASNKINLFCNTDANLKIEMYDAIGKLMLMQTKNNAVKGDIISINLSNVPKGIYSIKVQADNSETISKKIIVQ